MIHEDIFSKFHSFHGKNLVLDQSASVATRNQGFNHGIAFSEKNLQPGEFFVVEIEQNENRWAGFLRLGLTQLNPHVFRKCNTELPKDSLPDLLSLEESSWVYELNYLIPNTRELSWPCTIDTEHIEISEQMIKTCRGTYLRSILKNPLIENTSNTMRKIEVGYKVGIVYIPIDDELAELYYLMNGDLFGPYAMDIPYKESPLYVVVDIYGRNKKVKILQIQADQSLKQLCRTTIRKFYDMKKLSVSSLPKQIIYYLNYKHNSL